jgi:hypothetical protein
MRAPVALLVVALALLGSRAACGDEPGISDDATRAAARSLGFEGVVDLEHGRYAEAQEKLERAYAIVRVHTLGLWSARALVKRGRLAQAAERYLEVATMPVVKGDAAVQAEARATAATERAALMPRVPAVRLVLSGLPAKAVRITLDGAAFDTALLGVFVPVNPGSHEIEAEGTVLVRRRLDLAEGERQTVMLDLPALPTLGTEPERAATASSTARTRSMRLAGAAGLCGVGLASLVAGGIAGGVAAAQWSAAQAACPMESVCASDDGHRLSRLARASGAVANVAFGVAGLSAVGALVLWAAAPSRSAAGSVRVGVGPSGLATGGLF